MLLRTLRFLRRVSGSVLSIAPFNTLLLKFGGFLTVLCLLGPALRFTLVILYCKMSERPAEEGSEVDEKGNGPDARVSEDGKSILSIVNALTSKMTRPNSQPSSSTKGSRSSSIILLGASKPAVGRWTNRCALCNGSSSPRHSSTACCIVCRN